jgi:ABC-type transport system involved in cytochrome c biogenesis ATPase subunit
MKCGCVFWKFAKSKLVTRKDKIKIINTKRDGYATCNYKLNAAFRRRVSATKLFNKRPLAILNGTSNPIDLNNEHSLFQRISIHLHYDVKASKHLASLLTTD